MKLLNKLDLYTLIRIWESFCHSNSKIK